MATRKTSHQFDSAQGALDYHRNEGCGGWIFSADRDGLATIFHNTPMPGDVLQHPLAKGSGKLIATNCAAMELEA